MPPPQELSQADAQARKNNAQATARGRRFPATRWTLVADVRTGNEAAREKALAELCGIYWYPVYAFIRYRGKSPADAEDLAQEFFARLLSRDIGGWLGGVRGRLRSYLLGTLKHYLADERDRNGAQKRGGGIPHVSIEWNLAESRYQCEPKTAVTPETMYERAWAFSLLNRAFASLETEFAGTARESLFQDLKGDVAGSSERVNYPALAARHGMKEGAIRVTLHRMRKRFSTLVKSEIAETVAGPEEIHDEIQHLYAVFSR